MKAFKYLTLIALVGIVMGCGGEKHQYAIIETEFGEMKVMLYNDTPLHRDNFVKLVKEGFYDDLLFHRVIAGFMIQGGDPDSKDAAPGQRLGGGGPGYQIDAEIGKHFHVAGALAAARTGDATNPERKSSGSQFYIVHGQTVRDQILDGIEQKENFTYPEEIRAEYLEKGGAPFLDGQYTVFGKVVEGLDVIDKIANVQRQPGDRPVEDVKMKIRMAR
jgi:cyclophilin family peptidyl-prolyl cis-trans isomerase